MRNILFLLIFAGFLGPALSGHADEVPGRPMTVLELFTTQGCASCPPADAVFERLVEKENNDNLLAIGCHIALFDSQGWKDQLSLRDCDRRLTGYYLSGVADNAGVPNMILNGKYSFAGDKDEMAKAALGMAQSLPAYPRIPMDIVGDKLSVLLPETALEGTAEIWLIGFDKKHEEQILGGQNMGMTVTYVNYVEEMRQIMRWDGKPLRISIPLDKIKGDNYGVIAQMTNERGPTDIVAAGKLEK